MMMMTWPEWWCQFHGAPVGTYHEGTIVPIRALFGASENEENGHFGDFFADLDCEDMTDNCFAAAFVSICHCEGELEA